MQEETEYFDNSRLALYKRCPRAAYFRHERGWTTLGTEIALAFGQSWHAAMDVVWPAVKEGHSKDDVLMGAMTAFMRTWEEEGMPPWSEITPEKQEQLSPRTPGVAAEMLHHYIDDRARFIRECEEIIAVERPFAVPLYTDNPHIQYIGRLDKVVRREGRIYVIEHKTTSLYRKATNFADSFVQSFSPNSQVDGYTHGAHMLFGPKVRGVLVDAALVHKQIHDAFKFIPVIRALEQLDAWLVETKDWINRYLMDRARVEEGKVMVAFPKNTAACFDWNRPCPFLEICKGVPDPRVLDEPPEGLKYEPWEPFELQRLKELEVA